MLFDLDIGQFSGTVDGTEGHIKYPVDRAISQRILGTGATDSGVEEVGL